MQRYKMYLTLLMLIPVVLISQTWQSTVNLGVELDYGDRIDLFTNSDGNHILIHEGVVP